MGGTAADGGDDPGEATCLVSSCPAPSSACQLAACVGVACGILDAAAGAPCAENGGVLCDGAGACVECNTAADCQGLEAACVEHGCQSCSDATVNGAETDTDCGGGVCPKCDLGGLCAENGDCKGKLKCLEGTCQEDD